MCKRITFSLLICSLLASCSKVERDEDPIAQKELIPIFFNVEFSKEVTDFRSTAKSTGTPTTFLYLVFNKETGMLYKGKSFELGVFDDELPEGEYIFLFIVTDNAYTRSPSGAFNINKFEILSEGSPVYDVFHCRVDCEVKKGEGNSNQQVVLERMVGKVKIILEDEVDAIPDNIARIFVQAYSTPLCFTYYSDADDYNASGVAYVSSDIYSQQNPNTMSEFSMTSLENINYETAGGEHLPITIAMYAIRERTPAEEGIVDFDTKKLIVAQKTIENVFIERNKTVIYRGKLFDNITPPDPPDELPSSSFSVSINDTWGEVINETF